MLKIKKANNTQELKEFCKLKQNSSLASAFFCLSYDIFLGDKTFYAQLSSKSILLINFKMPT